MAHSADRSLLSSRFRRTRTQARRRWLALEGLEDRRLLSTMPYDLYPTGVDDSDQMLGAGVADPHYTLVATPSGPGNQAAQTTTGTASGWMGSANGSQWIAPTADQSNAGSQSASGSYTYETTATVATAGKGFIQGYLAADDNVSISINGKPTTFANSGTMGSLTSFKVFGDFVAGSKANKIDFIVNNGATGPTGLQVNNLTLDMAPAVTVDQPTITVAYGGTLTATGTFADQDSADSVSIASSRANGQITQVGSQNGTYTLTESNVTQGGTVTITGTDSQGNITTNTFQLVVQPPTLTAGGATGTNRANSTPTLVDPNLVLNDPDGPNLTTASVSIGANFTAGEDRLLFTSQNGITGAYNTSTGILTLSGSATPAQYQTALRSVAYQDINTNPATVNTAARTINFSIAPGTFNPANGHFYQFVRNPGITWTAAKAAADASSLYGLQGYLATLTSAAENVFAFSKTQSTGWIGASDANTPGHWKWVDGPETGLEFWQGDGTTGSAVNGQYSDWNQGEPNNSQNVEFYAQYLQSGLWNDLANTATVNGYLIEYGGSQGDPTLQLTSQATMNVVAQTTAPTVTSPAATVVVNTPTITLAGSAQAGSLVQIYNDANNNGVIDQGELVVGSEQLTAAQSSYSIDVTLDPNTTSHFLATAILGASAESDPTAVPAVTSDTIAPALPVVTSPAATSYNPNSTVAITGTAEAGSLVTVYEDTNNDGVVDQGDTVAGSLQLANGVSTFSVTAGLTANSTNHFLVTAKDQAGNESSPAALSVIADSIAPNAPTLLSPTSALALNNSMTLLTGTAEAGSIVWAYVGVAGLGGSRLAQTVANQNGTFSLMVPLTANSANNFTLTATDEAGNESGPTTVPTITEDSITPAAPTLDGTIPATLVNTPTVTVGGHAEAGSLIRVYRDTNGDGKVDDGDVLVGSTQMGGSGTAFTVDASLALDASNALLVTATDAAGNESVTASLPTITEDSTPPVVPALLNPTTITTTTASTALIVGSAEAGSVVRIYRDTNGDGTLDDGDTLVGTMIMGAAQTNFAFVPTLTAQAANQFLVTATDKAGNQSPTLAVPTITQSLPIRGTVFLDMNNNGQQDANEAPLSDRVVYVDLNGSGTFEAGEPTTTTDAQGHFVFASIPAGSAPVRELLNLDGVYQIAVSTTTVNQDGSMAIAAVPYSVFMPIPLNAGLGLSLTGEDPTARFVQSLYQTVLGRTGGDSEVASWVSLLTAGASQGEVVTGFVNSLEHRTMQVAAYYHQLLNRSPDALASLWVDRLRAGASEQEVVGGILGSAEYQASHTTADSLVRSLYRDVLGRDGASSEVAAWDAALAAGMSRSDVISGFVNSPEAADAAVAALYTFALRRHREGTTADFWTEQLGADATVADVAIGILASTEFQDDSK